VTEVAGRVAHPSEAAARAGVRSRARAPLAVAWARLRAHPGRAALIAAGVGAAAAVLVAVIGSSLIARDRAVRHALRDLPPSERSFRVDAFDLPAGQSYAEADTEVRRALARLAPGTPLRSTFFRELRIEHELVQLAAMDGLPSLVRLRSGRLPRICTETRCEVLQVGRASGEARLDEAGIHLVRVGTADLPERALFGGSIDTTVQAGDAPVLLLAAGAKSFDVVSAFDGFYRTYSWIAPIDPRRLHVWEIDRVLSGETRAQTEIARLGNSLLLSGPDQALIDARASGHVSAQRMVVVGGEASVLLLGFALIAAIGLRRGLANESRRLFQRGARRAQVWLAAGAEVGAMTIVGALAGVVAGVLAVGLISSAADLPALAVLRHSLVTPTAVGVMVGLWLAATALVLVTALASEPQGMPRRVRLLDVAAVGAAGAAALGLARGGLDADSLSSGNSRTLLVLLPGLICFVAAVVAVRLLRPAMRIAERGARRSGVALRVALLALSRAPVRTGATAAFLLVSIGLALFAASWRATLDDGARDKAAFAVPLDVTVDEGSRLVLPLDAAPLPRYEALGPGVRAYPILRRNANVAGLGASVVSPTVLGIPPDAISKLHWRSDFSADTPAEIARRVDSGSSALAVVTLPTDARSASLRVSLSGVPVRLDLVLRGRDGRVSTLELGERGRGAWTVRARLPATATGVVGLQISLATGEQYGFTHRDAEVGAAGATSGVATLGPLVVTNRHDESRVVTRWHGFLPRHGLRVRAGTPSSLAYAFTQGQTMLLRLPQPTDGKPLAVLASPDVARGALGGSLVLDFQDVRVPAHVVAVAKRFPAADDQGEGFVVADERQLAAMLDADAPGTGTAGELWLSVPSSSEQRVQRALAQPPFTSLDASSRRSLEHELAADPLARAITITLAAAAITALLLAVFGFWLSVLSELRDERGELFDLEAQGVSPLTLRRQFRLRALLLIAAGVVGGALLGLVLSQLVVSVIRVSATSAPPDPSLRLDPAWLVGALGGAALVVALLIVVEVVTRRAFRDDAPKRASWSLE
jgi:hypothetical protein